ncbi:MAG: hypothetical protein QXG40_07215 [Ignisphaera sp.]
MKKKARQDDTEICVVVLKELINEALSSMSKRKAINYINKGDPTARESNIHTIKTSRYRDTTRKARSKNYQAMDATSEPVKNEPINSKQYPKPF